MDFLTQKARSWGGTVLFVLVVVGSIAPDTSAQVFAPGALSKAHAPWRSATQCDTCHSANKKIDRKKCLSCHGPVAARIKNGKGFHGQKTVRREPCDRCHKEHRGEGASLIRWPDGGEARFDHDQTGWSLEGAHRKQKCAACHDPRRIVDPKVRAYLKSNPGAKTYLGLPTDCRACHFDEHRGSLGDRCERCHDERAFKPVPKFNHDKAWPLEGAHRTVPCRKCHDPKTDPRYDAAAFPRARAATYLKMRPVSHALCTDCHDDPHNDRFGADCLACHTMDSWTLTEPPKKQGFHDDTAFPLKGRHRFVPCERCHPKDKQGKRRLKPIAHDRCGTCHPNAHPDISEKEMRRMDCKRCHDNTAFKPSRFSIADHGKTGFPLEKAHRATACPDCHVSKMGPPHGSAGARHVKGFLASLVVSPWRMRADITPDRCRSCHATPHRDQFREKACTDCHDGRSWTIAPESFNHDRTPYPLRGKHRNVPCAKCHPKATDDNGAFVRYRGLEFSDCTPCHRDVHFGQFTRLSPKRSCRECHSVDGFTPTRFDHNDEKRCRFPLKGKHGTIGCERCHPKVSLEGKAKTVRYRPTMTDCDGCHEDVHEGAFRQADKLLQGKTAKARAKIAGRASAEAHNPWGIPASWYPGGPKNRTDCRACHSEAGWRRIAFDHRTTRFPLNGRHKQVACEKCHVGGVTAPLPLRCSGCHDDVHKGQLGERCEDCHVEEGFLRTEKSLARHNRTEFPLIGRHAALPCTECHRDVRSRGFNQTPTACEACHAADIPRSGESSVDHSGFRSGCERCHTPVGWKIAAFKGHDRCFPIGTISKHGSVKCEKCHQGSTPAALGSCDTGTFSCTQCHGCLRAAHQGISGYACEEMKCYECHKHP